MGVIECKDHNRRISIAAIEAFAKKCESVNANLRIFVARRGFTDAAVEKASVYGIEIFSPFDSNRSKLCVPIFWPFHYVTYEWNRSITGKIDFYCGEIEDPVEASSISISGLNIIDIVLRFAVFRRENLTPRGDYRFLLKSRTKYGYVECNLGKLRTKKIELNIHLDHKVRRKNVRIESATGFYDWKTKSFKPKAGSCIFTDQFTIGDLATASVVDYLPPKSKSIAITFCRLSNIDQAFRRFERRWILEQKKPTR